MEMKLENNEFWILENKKDDVKTLFNDINESLKFIKKSMKNGLESDDLELMYIVLEESSMKFKEISWKDIAMRLMKME